MCCLWRSASCTFYLSISSSFLILVSSAVLFLRSFSISLLSIFISLMCLPSLSSAYFIFYSINFSNFLILASSFMLFLLSFSSYACRNCSYLALISLLRTSSKYLELFYSAIWIFSSSIYSNFLIFISSALLFLRSFSISLLRNLISSSFACCLLAFSSIDLTF